MQLLLNLVTTLSKLEQVAVVLIQNQMRLDLLFQVQLKVGSRFKFSSWDKDFVNAVVTFEESQADDVLLLVSVGDESYHNVLVAQIMLKVGRGQILIDGSRL